MAVDADLFRGTMSQWASGVTVVTSTDFEQPVGITASSLASVSLDPPRVLVCVGKRLHTHEVIGDSGVFAVNILGQDQVEWGKRFAGLVPGIVDRFIGINPFAAETGAPILPNVLAWLDCSVAFSYDGGDHTIFVGDVKACGARTDGEPLLYFNRHWRYLDGAAPSQS